MISQENRVILGSFLIAGVALAGIVIVESLTELRVTNYPLVGFLFFAGLTVGLPQLYLARTDTSVDPRTRLRFAVIVTIIFAAVFADQWTDPQSLVIVLIAGGSFFGLVGYELYTGFQAGSEDGPADGSPEND